uniref:IlGF domain-containing protein n=1 Tax=Steinernema glaseri TaxID=37863 RepID=A0A1I8AFG9_9BILA
MKFLLLFVAALILTIESRSIQRTEDLLAFRKALILEYVTDSLMDTWSLKRARRDPMSKICDSELETLVSDVCKGCFFSRSLTSVDRLYHKCCGEGCRISEITKTVCCA